MRRIIACYFVGPGTGERWKRLAEVFAHTVSTQCPAWHFSLAKLPTPPNHPGASASHSANTAKLEHWCNQIAQASDGDEVLLIDSDTVILRPLDDVWQRPFDVAYTVRPANYPHPINGGVVFLRVSPSARLFMETWRTCNRRLLESRPLRDRWRKYAGINQRALGWMIEERLGNVGEMLRLPCAEWNCEDSAWATFDPERTRILHLKSALRQAVESHGGFGPPEHRRRVSSNATPHLNALARRWMALQNQLRGASA